MAVAEADVAEYLTEMRDRVCSRCVERPPGGPPCAPLGKNCGVEMHLPELIDSIHQVHSDLLEPYLAHNRKAICEKCAFLHSSICPCPMDYLSALIVEAVEAVDQRRGGEVAAAPRPAGGLEEIRRAYREAAGSWRGCDWPTQFGKTGLDLRGWSAAEARQMAAEQTRGTVAGQDWTAAANWLALAAGAGSRSTPGRQRRWPTRPWQRQPPATGKRPGNWPSRPGPANSAPDGPSGAASP